MSSGSIALGRGDLVAGRWQSAKERFEEAVAAEETVDAIDGLGEALWWLGDSKGGVELRERAYAEYRRQGETVRAAGIAVWLSTQYLTVYGNEAASNGWLGRAERILESMPPCPEQGWVAFRRGKRKSDPRASEGDARQVIAIARETRDRDLEVAGISLLGRALLGLGRTEEGFALLDESMAAALGGEVESIYVVSETCCSMIIACERTMELVRATQWCQLTDDYARRHGSLAVLAFCRITYATVLTALGRWEEAETELLEAHASYQRTSPPMCVLAISKLALLRLAQGRLAEATELLSGHEDHPGAAQAVASLHLANGAPAMAAKVATRRLDVVGNDALLSPPFLHILVEAALAQGDCDTARQAAERLAVLVEPTRCSGLIGASRLASGTVAAFTNDERATKLLEEALETFSTLGMPLEAARTRMRLAELLISRNDEMAKVECQTAKAAFERLGARRHADSAAELLRKLGAGGRSGPRLAEPLSRREQEVLDLVGLGLSNAEIGARLFISPKTVEHHVGHVLGKLNLKNRAAAAAYVVRTRPSSAVAKPGSK
jgi:ATP/maltotriose-dependent transcriptional regulator MalT